MILDDIISSGDTIIETLKNIKQMTNQKVTIVCAHFENNIRNKRLENIYQIEQIYSSNSLKKRGTKKLKLLNIYSLLK